MDKKLIVKYFDKIDSTNDYLSENIENNNIISDCLIIAKSQSNGHGSYGKTFISEDNGIYFSLGIFYDNSIIALTPKVAVAIYEAFSKLYNIKLSIKWINDLYFHNKKVAGILCKYIALKKCYIIGIGIDLYENKNITKDLEDIIGYIFDKKIDEQKLVFEIIDNIYNLLDKKLPDVYKSDNIVLNKNFMFQNKKYRVRYINDEGNMIAEEVASSNQEIFYSSYGLSFL